MYITLKGKSLSDPATARHVADLATIARAQGKQFEVTQDKEDLVIRIGN